MKVFVKFIFIGVFLFFGIVSCTSESEIYSGPTLIELPKTEIMYTHFDTDSLIVKDYLPIQIIKGSDSPKTISVIFSIEALNYKQEAFQLTPLEYILNSENFIDSIPLTIEIRRLELDKLYTFRISLSDSSSVGVAANYSSTLFKIIKYRSIYKFTGKYSCYEPINQLTYNVNFVRINDSVVANDNFWDFSDSQNKVNYNFDMNIGKIILNTTWTDNASVDYTIKGEGEFGDDGDFFTKYSIVRISDNIEVENGIHYFTKIK